MDDTDEEVLLRCVKIIFVNFLGANDELIKNVTHCLLKNNVLSKSQKKKIYGNVNSKDFKIAAQKIIESIHNKYHDSWTSVLKRGIANNEFPGDANLTELLTKLLSEKCLSPNIANLIYSWEILHGMQEELSTLLKKLCPDYSLPFSNTFVLEFILQCYVGYQTPVGQEVIASCEKLLSEKQAENIEAHDQEKPTTDPQDQTTVTAELQGTKELNLNPQDQAKVTDELQGTKKLNQNLHDQKKVTDELRKTEDLKQNPEDKEKVKDELQGTEYLKQNSQDQRKNKNESQGTKSLKQNPRSTMLSEKMVFECVKTSISRCVSLNGDIIGEYAECFFKSKLISKSHLKRILRTVKSGNCDDALGLLANISWDWCRKQPKKWQRNLFDATLDKEFPGDERIASLLKHLAADEPISKAVCHLLQSWKDWEESLGDIEKIAKHAWPDWNKISASDDKWPLAVILHCLNEPDFSKVLQFTNDVKKIIHDNKSTASKVKIQASSGASMETGDVSTSMHKTTNQQKIDQPSQQKALHANSMVPESDAHLHEVDKSGGEGHSEKQDHIDRKADRKFNENESKPAPRSKDPEELRAMLSADTSKEIEFRVILAEGMQLYEGDKLCMWTDMYGDGQSVHLTRHRKGLYCFCKLPLLRRTEKFEYKYYIKTSRGIAIWETFGINGSEYSNRYISIKDLDNRTILHDVALFAFRYVPYHVPVQNSIANHLLPATSLTLHCEKKDKAKGKFYEELFSWFYSVKTGYRLTLFYYEGFFAISSQILQTILLNWLQNNCEVLNSDEIEDKIRLVISTLMMVAGIHHICLHITDRKFLSTIFHMLAIHKLNENEQKLLYQEISTECDAHSIKTPLVLDAISSLFLSLKENPVSDFLLTLPLYWLVANEGIIHQRSTTKTKNDGSMLLQRSALPNKNNVRWPEIRRSMLFLHLQRDALKLQSAVGEIYQTHPLIAGSYQYFLSEKSLIEIIAKREENKIGNKFLVDSVLFQLLKACEEKRSSGDIRICNLRCIEDYLICELQRMIVDASAEEMESKDNCNKEKSLEVAFNILASMSSLFRNIAKGVELQNKQSNDDVLWCLNITSHAIELTIAINSKRADKAGFDEINKLLDGICASMTTRLQKCKVDKDQLVYWNSLITMQWHDESFNARWKEKVKNGIQKKIANDWKGDNEKFIIYYATQLESVELEEMIAGCFNDKAFQCTEALLAQSKKERGGFFSTVMNFLSSHSSTPRFVTIFDKLFKHELTKHASASPFTIQALNFLFLWPFAAHFYLLFNKKDLLSKFTVSEKTIKRVSAEFKKVVDVLKSGDISAKQLKLIADNRDKFSELHAVIIMEDSSVDTRSRNLSQIIDCRMDQLSAFYTAEKHIKGFLSACDMLEDGGNIDINTTELNKKLLKDVEDEILSKISPDPGDTALGGQKTFVLGLQPDVLNHFQEITFLKDSAVFQQIWHQHAISQKAIREKSLRGSGLWKVGWKEVVNEIWKGTRVSVLDLVQKIDTGNITMEHICAYFEKCSGKPEVIPTEIKTLYDYYHEVINEKEGNPGEEYSLEDVVYRGVKNIEMRMKQLSLYFKLEKAKETLDLLLRMRDELNLTGDFSSIELQKQNLESKHTMLRKQPDHQETPFVCTISQTNVECLKKFIREKELIAWLKKRMHNVSEVQVMCDLAMISAGESQIELAAASCLLSAVMGFAPLIFELNSSAGLVELIPRCQDVWKNRDSDEKLMEKWEDTARKLPWFKGIENLHGSVEKHSLALAQEINNHGVYKIKRESEISGLDVNDCILLTLPDKNEQSQTYNLQALCDLQSKLMLIAGEAEMGQNEVTNFVEVLNSIQVLATVFTKLVSAGCMLFSNWSALIRCDGVSGKKSDNLVIQISFGDDSPTLNGSGSLSDLNKLSFVLTKSLERWNDHISAKRSEHYFLNEFNIQQMIYLCHELTFIKNGLPEQVGILLSNVAENSSVARLQELLNEATKVSTGVSNQTNVGKTIERELEGCGEIDLCAAKARTVRHLVNVEMIDEDVAKASVQSEGYADSAACINWCLFYKLDKETVRRLSEQYDKEAGVHYNESEVCVIPSLSHDRTNSSIKDVINHLLKFVSGSDNLINCVNTICMRYQDETMVITLQDYLSIEHLGRFLHLLCKDAGKTPIARELARPFISGRPNLLIRHEQEILASVLQLYMMSPDQRLPSASEVLVCSKQTSVDEVERFLRRAMCKCEHKGHPIFTLAFADKLEFRISAETERIFNRLSQDADEDYQLVILLSDPKHYLATCFDKYVLDMKQSSASQDIQKYLKRHLKVSNENLWNSAACADSKHSMVKVVSSTRSGVGKSLHVQRLTEELARIFDATPTSWHRKTIRLLERTLDLKYVTDRLFHSTTRNSDTMLVHIDLTPAVQNGIDAFVFNLFVLGSIQDYSGKIWKRHPNHFYLLEITDGGRGRTLFSSRHIINLLPVTKCFPPKEVLDGSRKGDSEWIGMDQQEFESTTFQRPFQYLKLYDEAQGNWSMLDSFVYTKPKGSHAECIEVLLRHCCMNNPSWAQLRHFASFLNVQLHDCENSMYCKQNIVGRELPGLKGFAVRFMIRMSQDFATPSLNISDESAGDNDSDDNDEGMKHYQFRRKWEESTHPYLFFNEDHVTMSFVNVKINDDGDLLDKNDEITEPGFITKELVKGLKLQRLSLDLNFDSLTRERKLHILCKVMGIQTVFDPDPTYELTTDNVLKILAIYMRFRCGIPVIIMGETGCGKTRMVEFISKLKSGSSNHEIKSMITLKIHGGITVDNVHESVRKAQEIAEENMTDHQLDTILFYDEANTTEAIYAIKEVMCDLTIDGESFVGSQLKLVAACNPYKQLSKEAIKKLEDSGLGYRMKTSETSKLFGNIPMRTLVYRVVALPPSMQPFVWDFGQLSDEAERMYIKQMTKRLGQKLELDCESMGLINAVLSKAQNYMRGRKDECRYVSLRDVERCVTTYEWFHNHKGAIYYLIEEEIERRYKHTSCDAPETDENLRTLILTIGVCYHASLNDRSDFREQVSSVFGHPVSAERIKEEISAAQRVFLENMDMDDNIARNEALQENVFMMTVCADMRIPLFLVGKPGSSKSLAKTIVAENMQRNTSKSPFCRNLKQVHILSYQCSALTDAAGIKSVFKQCAQLQADQDLNFYTAVVVLDEIGLAEDSENMPLKVLHPLLECGSTNHTSLTEFDAKKKVGFIGISNWALDPAKMNRGIFVTRSKPSKEDLKKTAKGIFQQQKSKIKKNSELLDQLTDSYMEVYDEQKVEYFGLRDYYSLIKMVHKVCTATENASPTPGDVSNAIHRNFSGGKHEYYETFRTKVECLSHQKLMSSVSIQKMISDNLKEKDSRFLLLLTNQFSASSLLHLCLDDFENSVQVIFGSSFKGDHNYTDICRNINRVKVCMETGKTVVLLNMTEIHESLYDALNQHFVSFGGHRYVDLGLGGHRVKCRIAENFRLIVIEQKEVVYEKYPIPLINRLEKHHLDSQSLLSNEQRLCNDGLKTWANQCISLPQKTFTGKDAFVGYHEDTIPSIVLTEKSLNEEVHKAVLLQSATMDAIFRLPESELGGETESIQALYLHEQIHDSLLDLLKRALKSEIDVPCLEVISFSNILSESDRQEIERELDLRNSVMLLSLEQFQTEHEYLNKLDEFFKYCEAEEDRARVLLIQCSQAQSEYHGRLIACARYCLSNKMKERRNTFRGKAIVALLLSTEREGEAQDKSGTLLLQHAGDNQIIYVDELRPTSNDIAPASHFYNKSLRDILQLGAQELKGERSEASLINILSLLRDCVLEAVTKVKCRLSKRKRYFERILILYELFADGNKIGSHFRVVLMEKMIDLYSNTDENLMLKRDWIVGEACNRDSLQEGGTFRKTLWLCLKNHISKVLGYVISITDRQDNLDLLLETEKGWKINMWLAVFKCLPLSWSSLSRAQEFLIKAPPQHKETVPCNVPFSFQLHDFFINHWETLSQQITPYFRQRFFRLFRQSEMFRFVVDALSAAKDAKLMKLYAEDLVKYSYVPGTEESEETEVITDIVYETSMKQIIEFRKDPEYTRGDELALVFLTYKEQSICLDILSEIFHTCPELLGKANEWINQFRESENNFTIHISAFLSLLELLEKNARELNEPRHCLKWKMLMSTTRRIFNKLIVYVNSQDKKDKILKKWIPLNLVYLAIDQLLPRENLPEFERYVAVVSSHTKRLLSGAVGRDARSHFTMRITCDVLKRIYEDIKLKLKIQWEDITCKLCKKRMERPVSLPCGHFICDNCVRALTIGGGRCPTCNAQFSEDLENATLSNEQRKEVENFQSICTSFFLEYLKDFCFSSCDYSQMIPMEAQVKSLISEFVVDAPVERREYECSAIDKNINLKASVLRIVLDHSPVLTKNELNVCLGISDRDVLEELVLVVLKCFENKIFLEAKSLSDSRRKSLDKWEKMLAAAWRNIMVKSEKMTKLELIQTVAEVRCCLLEATHCIDDVLKGKKLPHGVMAKAEGFVSFVVGLCSGNDGVRVLQEYIIKTACLQYGSNWFHLVKDNNDFEKLIPVSLYEAKSQSFTDYWPLIGEKYSKHKSGLYKTADYTLNRVISDLLRWGEPKPRLARILSLVMWMDKKNDDVKKLVVEHMKNHDDHGTTFFKFLIELHSSFIPALQATELLTEQQLHTLFQLITVTVAMVTSRSHMMDGFLHMLTLPSVVENMFLPGMPESPFFSVPTDMRFQGNSMMYTCPNGHLYAIGECRNPTQTSKCPDCGATIGGANHKPAAGNQRYTIENERTQAGYLINNPGNKVVDAADRISKQGAAIIQFLLHTCLLIGLENDQQTVLRMIKKQTKRDAQKYLVEQLLNNMQTLSDALARNMDETVMVLHHIILHLLNQKQGPAPDWSTLDKRRQWETLFRSTHLLPIFQNLDVIIAAAQERIHSAENHCNLALYRLIREARPLNEPDSAEFDWMNPMLWMHIRHSSSAHLLQYLGDNPAIPDGVLKIILDSADLQLVKYLEPVLQLQSILIQKYQNNVDMKDTEDITFEEFEEDGGRSHREVMDKYFAVWNKVVQKLEAKFFYERHLKPYFVPMGMTSPISSALPSTRGRGQCAKILAEYLINLQNDFLTKCKQVMISDESIEEEQIPQLFSSHFVCVDKNEDLLPLIDMHTKYNITIDGQGRHHQVVYNIDALEKQAREKFAMYKKLIIKQTLPMIQYPQDIGIGSDWNKVLANTPQQILPAKLIQDVDGMVSRVTSADVCEGVRTLTHAISFLAKVRSNPKQYLYEFLEKDLLLSANRLTVIPKSVQIAHCLALYNRLSWHKSVHFVLRGLNPYKDAFTTVQRIEDDGILEKLDEAFKHSNVVLLQQRLNEMLIKIPDFNADWSLTEIFPDFDFIGDDGSDDSWYSRLPDEICFKHAPHLFSLAAKFSSKHTK